MSDVPTKQWLTLGVELTETDMEDVDCLIKTLWKLYHT